MIRPGPRARRAKRSSRTTNSAGATSGGCLAFYVDKNILYKMVSN
jgi:hypothetical protein